MPRPFLCFSSLYAAIIIAACTNAGPSSLSSSKWQLVDNFEDAAGLNGWTNIDVDNQTDPFIPNPQVSIIQKKANNSFMLRKPAAEGVIGNRKAIGFKPLPAPINTGETYTIYTRFNVESFPNNHSFGLSNLPANEVGPANYNAFEPMIRITDKAESDGSKNDGTLMVLSGFKTYSKIEGLETGQSAMPLTPGEWYQVWWTVNNAPAAAGGQSYDLYIQGGEFETQTKVYSGATFRMKREAPLLHFMAISNTGPKKSPYGNGGVRYDDIYMAKGTELSTPPL